MKFSARTIQILRNFATVHQALLFKSGSTLKVMSESKSILAKATLEDNIEGTFAIYDMPKFLSALRFVRVMRRSTIPALSSL